MVFFFWLLCFCSFSWCLKIWTKYFKGTKRLSVQLSSSTLDSCGLWHHRKHYGNVSGGRRLQPLCSWFPTPNTGNSILSKPIKTYPVKTCQKDLSRPIKKQQVTTFYQKLIRCALCTLFHRVPKPTLCLPLLQSQNSTQRNSIIL